ALKVSELLAIGEREVHPADDVMRHPLPGPIRDHLLAQHEYRRAQHGKRQRNDDGRHDAGGAPMRPPPLQRVRAILADLLAPRSCLARPKHHFRSYALTMFCTRRWRTMS